MATGSARVALLRAPPPPRAYRSLAAAIGDDVPFSRGYLFQLLRCLGTVADAAPLLLLGQRGVMGGAPLSVVRLLQAIHDHLLPLSLDRLNDTAFTTAVSESLILPIATYGYCASCQESAPDYAEPVFTLARLVYALTDAPPPEASTLLDEVEQTHAITIPATFDLHRIQMELVWHLPAHPLAPLVRDTLAWLQGGTGFGFTDLCGTCLYDETGYSLWEAAYYGDTFLSLKTLCLPTLMGEWEQARQVLGRIEALQSYVAHRSAGFEHLWHFLIALHDRITFPHVRQLSLPLNTLLPEVA